MINVITKNFEIFWKMANKSQDNRNCLMHIDYVKQTPRRLFQDWDRDQYDIFVEINHTSQVNRKQSLTELLNKTNLNLLINLSI